MKRKKRTKLIHEGEFVAEVEVDLLETDEGWSPYLSLDDAYKLDDVRESLRRGDLQSAAKLGPEIQGRAGSHTGNPFQPGTNGPNPGR